MKDQLPHIPEAERLRFQADVYIGVLKDAATEAGISPFQIDHIVRRKIDAVRDRLNNKDKMQGLPLPIRTADDPQLKLAGAFFREIVTPLIATGRDAYKPNEDDKLSFCQRLNGEGVDIVQYYAAHKTKSPTRTGSPDTLVDLAELEMLKNYSVMSHVASHFGMSLKFIIVDESDAVPSDNILGCTQDQKDLNSAIVARMLNILGAEDKIIVSSLVDSIATSLGQEVFDAIYESEIDKSKAKVVEQLNNNVSNALTIRIFTFLDCTSDEGFVNLGLSLSDIDRVREVTKTRDTSELLLLPTELLSYVIGLTAHVDTIMGMRPLAAQAARENGLQDKFPQFSESVVYGGVTRNVDRWSFLTHPVRFNAETINPTHGLAVYNGEEFAGVAHFANLTESDKFKLIYLGEKPIGAIQV